MADDPIGGGLLTYGAVGGSGRELLRYDGTVWTRLTTTHAPVATESFGLAFDSRRDRLVLTGGLDGPYAQEATWEWDRSDWQPLRGGPRGGAGYRMLFDSRRGVLLLFGNESQTSLHQWDGQRWLPVAVNPQAPERDSAAHAFDRRNGVAVRFGGIDPTVQTMVDETWTFDGVGLQLQTPANSPGAGAAAAMAFDEARGTVLLFGGSFAGRGLSDETWEWNGSDWRRLMPGTAPPARQSHAMAWDRQRARMVMFGGNTGMNDTWEWDGRDWLPTSPTIFPPGAYLHALAYDEARQRTVLFGSSSGPYEWDGVDWQARRVQVAPGPRSDHGMAYDEARRRVMLFGGSTIGTYYADTWQLTSEVEAAYLLVGPGCGGSGTTPELRARSARLPWQGEGFPIEVAPLPAGSTGAAIIYGLSRTSWFGLPLPVDLAPIGAPGCPLRVSLDLSARMATAGSAATHTVVLPTMRVLLGRSFFQQAFALAPGANALGAVMSSAREAVIGTR